jgi:hypothetical protein
MDDAGRFWEGGDRIWEAAFEPMIRVAIEDAAKAAMEATIQAAMEEATKVRRWRR